MDFRCSSYSITFHFKGVILKIQNIFSSAGTDAVNTNCAKCGLYLKTNSGLMSASGQGKKSILIVGEAPGRIEDLKGKHWQGVSGQALRETLALHDIDLEEDCWSINAVNCFTGKTPTKKQIKLCRFKLQETIEDLHPKYIILLGSTAVASVLSEFLQKLDISKLHGNIMPIKEYNAWVLPLYHPSYVVKNDKDRNLKSVYNRDVEKAVNFINEENPLPNINLNLDGVHLLTDIHKIEKAFKQLWETVQPVAFDYETTGTKPFIEGHKITSIAISSEFGTFAFPFDYQDYWSASDFDNIWDNVEAFLTNDNIYKVAHNAKFEQMWSEEIFEIRPQVGWCTMDTQHILDHRTGITGLKHQVFVRWGIHGYDDSSKKYIKSDTTNGFNKMDEMPLGEQLLYVALDAKLTRRLYFEQMIEISEDQEKARQLFRDTSEVFLDMQLNGLPVNENHYKEAHKSLTTKIDSLTTQLKIHPEILTFNKENQKEFSETSPKDLQKLLFEQMELKSTKKTPGGAKSVDAEVLKEIDNPITKVILGKRKALKLRDTYLAQSERECVDGYINPNFTLNIARSFRSSCLNPNLQNAPKRDKEAKEVVRKGIVPSPGCVLMEVDYSGIEVSVSALYHKDPVFINYLISDDADMHTDLTLQLWNITKEQKTKELRFYTKNCWTFPQFYGDYFGNCAPNLWKNCVEGKLNLSDGTPLLTHLKEKKLHTLTRFTEHCKDVENDMWKRRFKVYTQWKNDINESYIKNGFVDTYLGFRFNDYLNKKQTTNFPVQSTAAHLLFWSLIQTTKKIQEHDLEAVLIGQIHDSMILDVPLDEINLMIKFIKQVCEVDLANNFPWVTIPMKVEIEISKSFEHGGNFSEMEEV